MFIEHTHSYIDKGTHTYHIHSDTHTFTYTQSNI